MASLTTPGFRFISDHEIAQVRQNISNDQNALFVLRAYQAGDIIADFSAGTISSTPTYLTVQISEEKHITLQPEFLQYINHSCEPNVFFDTTLMKLVALKHISVNEELTFFYPSTEWKMDQPFRCYCRNACCLGQISGAAYLSPESIKHYRFTDFIQQQINKHADKQERA
jgi:hypothetical protein